MGYQYTCDLCHRVIKNGEKIQIGTDYTITGVTLHLSCAPVIVRFLKKIKAKGSEELQLPKRAVARKRRS